MIGFILGIERLPEQDSYDTENCYYYMFPFLCIELHNRNTHKKYIDCSSLEAAPTTYDASLFSLRKVSLFSFSVRPTCDVQTWSFKCIQHWRGRNSKALPVPVQVTCYTCSLLTKIFNK